MTDERIHQNTSQERLNDDLPSSRQTPLITVIMPIYNAGDHLADSINSVLAQDCDNWELILVDDASTDGSLEMARHFGSLDKRIRVVECPRNSGTASAPRNEGLARATGQYVTFLDADDVYDVGRLAQVLDVFTLHPNVDVVMNDWIFFTECVSQPWGGARFDHVLSVWPKGDYWDRDNRIPWITDTEGFRLSLLYGIPASIDCFTIRRTCVLAEHDWFRVDWSNGEDSEFMVRFIHKRKMAFLPTVLVFCREQGCLSAQIVAKQKGTAAYFDLIVDRYRNELSKEDQSLLCRKAADALFSLGWNLHREGDSARARKCYIKSLRFWKTWRVFPAFTKTLVPVRALKCLHVVLSNGRMIR